MYMSDHHAEIKLCNACTAKANSDSTSRSMYQCERGIIFLEWVANGKPGADPAAPAKFRNDS
jgi:hypothetical protein